MRSSEASTHYYDAVYGLKPSLSVLDCECGFAQQGFRRSAEEMGIFSQVR